MSHCAIEIIRTDIADKMVTLRRKPACVPPRTAHYPAFLSSGSRHSSSNLRERPERPSQPSMSTPRPSSPRPSSPCRLHVLPMPSQNIIVSEVPPQMEANLDDFSRRLKLCPNSPRAAHSRPAANDSPGKLYNQNAEPVRRPVTTMEPGAISNTASSSSPGAMPLFNLGSRELPPMRRSWHRV